MSRHNKLMSVGESFWSLQANSQANSLTLTSRQANKDHPLTSRSYPRQNQNRGQQVNAARHRPRNRWLDTSPMRVGATRPDHFHPGFPACAPAEIRKTDGDTDTIVV